MDAAEEGNTYVIRPNYADKFRPAEVQAIVHSVLAEFFADKQYDAEQALAWTTEVCDLVRDRLKGKKDRKKERKKYGRAGRRRGLLQVLSGRSNFNFGTRLVLVWGNLC